MNIWLKTSLNLTHLTILNANFNSYQLNYCNCLFNCLSDITKLFCCRFNASEDQLFYLLFCQIGSPTNWLANKFVPSNCLPPNWSLEIVAYLSCAYHKTLFQNLLRKHESTCKQSKLDSFFSTVATKEMLTQ